MEGMGVTPAKSFWSGRRVFVTGHTGFKGSWLSLWLQAMGAEVHGYALAPATTPALFEVADVQLGMASHTLADIRDLSRLENAIKAVEPEIVLHLAAQPLVRYSYQEPIETFAVNVMGTANLLQAVRSVTSVRAVVSVTTDKCYENQEWIWPYREIDALGGHDPYSASKACAELVTAAFRKSYSGAGIPAIASARAGNVIGGGDWANDRLIPDFLRAIDSNERLEIRAPNAVRPWQHVLEPLAGYLVLAEKLYTDGGIYAEAWNFGPVEADARPVAWLVRELTRYFPECRWDCDESAQDLHEAGLLRLDSSKAHQRLKWVPRWNLAMALEQTSVWHQAWRSGEGMRNFSLGQIANYMDFVPEVVDGHV